MLVYWLLLGFFAFGALIERSPAVRPQIPANAENDGQIQLSSVRTIYPPLLILGAIGTIFLVGLRYKVGADWNNYIEIFHWAKHESLESALKSGDPGYQAINWTISRWGYGIWVVNLIAAAIFGWGLLRFCATQPRPWLAFAIAIPYLVIVVAMGYTRQGIALGILMAGLAQQAKGASAINFALYVAGAALFHSTSIFIFPIVAWSARGNPMINALLVLSIGIMLYRMFLGHTMDRLVTNYLDAAYSSQGALVRVSMNMAAASCFLFFGKRMGFIDHEYRMWRNFMLAAFAMMVLLAAVSSSTAVDRLSLYLLPLQIAVIARLPLLTSGTASATVIAVLGYVTMVQYVWLNFAQFANHWIPYQFTPMS